MTLINPTFFTGEREDMCTELAVSLNCNNHLSVIIVRIVTCVLLSIGLSGCVGKSETPNSIPVLPTPKVAEIDGAKLFKEHCAHCHSGIIGSTAPTPDVLKSFPPESVMHALSAGIMRSQGYSLSREERRALSVFTSGRPFALSQSEKKRGMCSAQTSMPDPSSMPGWKGWGNGITNNNHQIDANAGVSLATATDLKLKWSFGYSDSFSAWSQPVVQGGRVFVGSQAGVLYSLDAKTGCTYWSFSADAGIRAAVNVAKVSPNDDSLYAVIFGDLSGVVYALSADTGTLLWKTEVESHEKARITGSPTLHEERLYVPMSSWASVTEPEDICCTFRGSISSIDINTGAVVWKSHTIPEPAVPLQKLSRLGAKLWGPSGAAIWSAPTIDSKRNALYVGTGNNYTGIAEYSDSILAFDLDDGRLLWNVQLEPDDIWLSGCAESEIADANSPCEFSTGGNFDIATAPMLIGDASGFDMLVVGQKSGMAYGLAPGEDGAIRWQYRAGKGGPAGGIIWGSAVDSRNAYFPVSDVSRAEPGGIHAVDWRTGKRHWVTGSFDLMCGEQRYGCNAAQGVGIAVSSGVLFAGALDGGFRAYNTNNGEVVWQFDTNRDFETVNEVKANGGSLMGVGPTIVDGMVYVNSGYATNGGRDGNVLLAFSIE